MNIRKPSDYSSLYSALDVLMGSELTEMELYCGIGRAVCGRTEKGAAVMAAEYLQAKYPDRKGFSPRNLRRMRSFYLAYGNTPAQLEKALGLAWTQNVTILEACKTAEERAWYLNATLEYGWGKAELLRQIQSGAWMTRGLDEPEDICYTEANKIVMERGESEKDTFYLSRQYLSEPNGRVRNERLGKAGWLGVPIPNRICGNQPGGDREPYLSSCTAQTGGAWDILRGSCGPAAHQSRLREVRPADWDGSGQPPGYVPYLRWRFCGQDAPTVGLHGPPRSGGSRPVVHRRLRSHLVGCVGGLSGAAV